MVLLSLTDVIVQVLTMEEFMNRSKNLFIPNICKKLLQVGKFETVSDVQSNIISEPTHFTESLFSLFDLFLVKIKTTYFLVVLANHSLIKILSSIVQYTVCLLLNLDKTMRPWKGVPVSHIPLIIL